MGFLSGVGGALGGIGKFALSATELTGKTAMGATEGLGKSLMNNFNANSFGVIGAVATGAIAGAGVADLDGKADITKPAMTASTFALGATAMPLVGGMAASAITGVGVAAGGAAMMGVNAVGTIGSAFLRTKTQGEKAEEITKSFKNRKANKELFGKDINKYNENLAKEIESAGAKVGSTDAMKIGLDNMDDFKMRKGIAIPLIAGASLLSGVGEAVKAFEQSRMGTYDGIMRKATPSIPMVQQSGSSGGSYSNNAGATGDLVFALHKNR
jgi:hypothetical protein